MFRDRFLLSSTSVSDIYWKMPERMERKYDDDSRLSFAGTRPIVTTSYNDDRNLSWGQFALFFPFLNEYSNKKRTMRESQRQQERGCLLSRSLCDEFFLICGKICSTLRRPRGTHPQHCVKSSHRVANSTTSP